MTREVPEGFYLDRNGQLQRERRRGRDRRNDNPQQDALWENRRKSVRRKADRDALDREHKAMIDEALDEFASGDSDD